MAYRHAVRRSVVMTGLAVAALSFSGIGASAQGGVVTVGSNYSDAVPKAAFQAALDYCATVTGDTYTVNTVDHGTFQDQISSYLQGTPDDVFTWFAGYRAKFFADQGLVSPVSDVWAEIESNYNPAFKAASTGNDGEQYFVPFYNYPWVVIYNKALWDEKGYAVPTDLAGFTALATQMQADGLIPVAFADKDGWPAMGTFDILNMRINGYAFHTGLMAGTESWTDPKVTAVFEAWKSLLPVHQQGALGRTWQEAAQDMIAGRAGMYFLGTFAGEQADEAQRANLDFFPFPTLGTDFDVELGIDAPIDGFMTSANPKNPEGAKALLKCLSTGAAQNAFLAVSPNNVGAANDVDTSTYTPFQQKAAEIIAGSGAIAQFLDRDTRPDFAGPNGMQGFLQSFLGEPDQDLATLQQEIQDFWDTLPPQ
jgi:multiple sugar transport system substrate-binding protein